MAAPLHTAADFLAAEQSLMPTGPVWPRDADAVQTTALSAFAPSGARIEAAAEALLTDAFPATAVDLLPEWEASLGLPDPCAGVDPTLEQRQAQVVARFAGAGGQTEAFYVAFALALGFSITIETFAPFECGRSRCGDPMYGPQWAYVWRVTAVSLFGWDVAVLQCELQRVAPAYTLLIFA